MNLLEKAIAIALHAHQGQLDRCGEPYILHPLRLMLQMETDAERMAAVLHDVVEDTALTLADLEAEGFPQEVLEAVRLLTHDRSDHPYEQYVRTLKENPIARKVKLADLQHNMDIRRLDGVQQTDLERLQRYRQAWETLRT
ncbi:MAG: GTP pyrophosphokinase [Chloroflexota bacterium]